MTPDADLDSEPTREPFWTRGRIAAATIVVALAVFWIAGTIVYWNDGVDRLDDRDFVAAAEQRCALALATLEGLPPASDAETPQERARQVEESTAVLAEMVDDLEAIAPQPTGEREDDDGTLVGLWLDDWRTYLDDRLAHAERLADGEDVRFLVTADGGVSVDSRADQFAAVNDMPSCRAPSDIA